MVGSAAIKQGRSANRKHTFFFWPNMNAFIKFGEILSICSQDIEWKPNACGNQGS